MSSEWSYMPFSSLYEIPARNGLTKPKSVRGKGIKFINMGELYSYNRIYNIETDRVPVTENERMNFLLSEGDLLFARQSLVLSGVGKCSIIKDIQEDTTYDSHIIRVRLNPKKASPDFYYYLFSSNIGKQLIQNIASQVAAAGIRGSDLSEIEVPIPPINEQKAIASILSSLDDKIELNNRINKILEEIAQAIFKRWFVDFEFPDENGKPYKSSGGEMVESEMGWIPKGWKVGTLDYISKKIICGKTPSTIEKDNFGSYMPFITIPDMHNKVFITKTKRYLSQKGVRTQENKTIPPYSICVSCIATPGLVCLTTVKSQTNQQINSIICKDNISCYYVYLVLVNYGNEIRNLGSGGSTTLNLNKSQFSKIGIIIPAMNYLLSFHEVIKPIFSLIENNQSENELLVAIRNFLLPKLINGDIVL